MHEPDSSPGWAKALERHATPIVVALTLFALAVRLVPAIHWPVWHDEAETWLASRVSPLAFLLWEAHPIHPPFSFALVRLSTEILGTHAAWALRLPAVLASTLAVPAAYAVGRLAWSRRFGVGFAAFLAVSPELVLQGRTARMYPFVVLAALVAFTWLLRLEGRGERRPWPWLGLGLVFAAAVGSHYLGLAVWLGAVAAVWLHARDRGGWGHPMARGVGFASLPPLATLLAGVGVPLYWASYTVPRVVPDVLRGDFSGQNVRVPDLPAEALPLAVAAVLVLAGAVAIGVIGLRRIHRRRPLLASLLAWTAGLSIPIAFAGALVLVPALPRYLILVELALVAGIAAFAFQGTSRAAFALGLALVVLPGLAALDPAGQRVWHDAAEITERVADRRVEGEAIRYYPCYLRLAGHYYGLPPGPPPPRRWSAPCLPESYFPVREPAAWLIVGHTFPGNADLRAVAGRLGDVYDVPRAAARIDGALREHGAVAARFTRGRLELLLTSSPRRRTRPAREPQAGESRAARWPDATPTLNVSGRSCRQPTIIPCHLDSEETIVSDAPIDLGPVGLSPKHDVHRNLPAPALVEHALRRDEGLLVRSGAFRATTGAHTGRTPSAKATVAEPEVHDEIWWGPVNKPIPPETFDRMHAKTAEYLSKRRLFVFDGYAGADPNHRLNVRVVNENAWHNLFAHNLFLRPTYEDLGGWEPEFTILHAPGLTADPETDGTPDSAFVLISYAKRLVLIGGTRYAGEIKKSIFTVMNYRMPKEGVLPMHCSANVGEGGDVALFFGLSGTGKTTLSADPDRMLIGDDEHGWSDQGVFNFEGGSYAKTIHLSKEKEPLIWEAIRFGTVLENVVVDERRRVDYDDDSITENTRAGYPVQYIPRAVIPGIGGHPRNVMFLTADAFGVLPPISRLTPQQAMYHFMSGYTAKVAGTEAGVDEPKATFSACFGAPFLPLHPSRYAEMLGERVERHGADVWLVNTGWTGGPYGTGHRMALEHTRAMVSAALSGALDGVPFHPHPIFKVHVPERVPGVPDEVLDPRNTWDDGDAYDRKARELAGRFRENVENYEAMPEEIVAAGPEG